MEPQHESLDEPDCGHRCLHTSLSSSFLKIGWESRRVATTATVDREATAPTNEIAPRSGEGSEFPMGREVRTGRGSVGPGITEWHQLGRSRGNNKTPLRATVRSFTTSALNGSRTFPGVFTRCKATQDWNEVYAGPLGLNRLPRSHAGSSCRRSPPARDSVFATAGRSRSDGAVTKAAEPWAPFQQPR